MILHLLVALQQPVSLGEPVTAPEPFTGVFAVHELADGRVLATDSREHAIRLIDFARNQVSEIGRNGAGPREHGSAFSIMAGRGDTVRIYDGRHRRYLLLDGNALILGTEPVPEVMYSERAFSPPLGDARGGYYFTARRMDSLPGGKFHPARYGDIFRWQFGAERLQLVAQFAQRSEEQTKDGLIPFPFADAWTVTPDGRIGRVVADDYHVEWLRDGTIVARGEPVRYRPVTVDEREQEAWYTAQEALPPSTMRNSSGEAVTTGRPRRSIRELVTASLFPPVKPPFEGGYLPYAPNGELWVARSRAHDDERTIIDVFDGTGRAIRQIVVAAPVRIVGFGATSVYMARRDEDDLEWLEKYTRP